MVLTVTISACHLSAVQIPPAFTIFGIWNLKKEKNSIEAIWLNQVEHVHSPSTWKLKVGPTGLIALVITERITFRIQQIKNNRKGGYNWI